MKKTITYREITIAIGIIVAMVVALTLWTRVPEEKLSGAAGSVDVSVPSAVEYVMKTAVKMFSEQADGSLDRR